MARAICGGLPAVMIASDGPYESFRSPGIDDLDRIVFQASLEDWSQGIFAGPDPTVDKVIVRGDSLSGSTVANLDLGRYEMNPAGAVALPDASPGESEEESCAAHY